MFFVGSGFGIRGGLTDFMEGLNLDRFDACSAPLFACFGASARLFSAQAAGEG